ncbi:TRAP transporter large permease [bacterium]|nr:TRAP transporter large permease [bacterium]
MDPILISFLSIVVLITLIFLGIHIATALISVSVVALYLITEGWRIPFGMLSISAYRGIMEYIFGTAPLFIVMGLLANSSGASNDLYDAANIVFRRVRGGIAIATVAANAVFASITGVSVASAAVFSKIAIPQMQRLGYNHRFSLGTVAGSSILGMLIPPSILLILYGLLTEEAIGKLFIAGIIPGIVMSLIFSLGIFILVSFKPSLAGKILERKKTRRLDDVKNLVRPWPILVVIFLVLGGIYLGFVTPTEAAAVGAAGALGVTIFKRKFTVKSFWGILLETGNMNASIGFLMISAIFFSKMLSFSGFTAEVTQTVLALEMPPLVVVWAFILILIVLGSFLDSTSIILIAVPIIAPIIQAMGFDMIWFGIVCVVAVEMGLITPPFGMVVFAMKAALGEEAKVEDIFIGAFPFFIMMIITLAILVYFPSLSTWLPKHM